MKVKHRAAKALSFALAATMVLSSGSMVFADTEVRHSVVTKTPPVFGHGRTRKTALPAMLQSPMLYSHKDPAASGANFASRSSSSSSASSGSRHRLRKLH